MSGGINTSGFQQSPEMGIQEMLQGDSQQTRRASTPSAQSLPITPHAQVSDFQSMGSGSGVQQVFPSKQEEQQ